MQISLTINDRPVKADIAPDTILLDFLRDQGMKSVKRGCDTANCGLCTVTMDGHPVLSCGMLAMRANGHKIRTLEGYQEEAKEFGGFMADQGADQCGYCNSGFIMNVICMLDELTDPTEDEIKEYLAGNLCRCSGFLSQTRAILNYLSWKKEGK